MVAIPAEYHDLFEKRTFAHVGTVLPSGAPHVTPVWIDYSEADERLLVNTERGRQKERNVRRDPSASVSILDPDDPYRYLAVVGEVTGTDDRRGPRPHRRALPTVRRHRLREHRRDRARRSPDSAGAPRLRGASQ